jgi:hypothetical protein
MATTNIVVPNFNDVSATIKSGIWELSTILDGGDDVCFLYADGTQAYVTALFLNTQGAVKFRGPNPGATAVTLTFLANGWTEQAVGFVYATGTDASLGLHAKAGF